MITFFYLGATTHRESFPAEGQARIPEPSSGSKLLAGCMSAGQSRLGAGPGGTRVMTSAS